MFECVKKKLWIARNARMVKHHYKQWPYHLYQPVKFDDFNHEHTCIAARLANVDLADICPLKIKRGMIPGDEDECEQCRYFGMINYRFDPSTGKKQLYFELRADAVSLFETEANS